MQKDDFVYLNTGRNGWMPTTIKDVADTPRSYFVESPHGEVIRRKSKDLYLPRSVWFQPEAIPGPSQPDTSLQPPEIECTTQKDGESIDSFIAELKGLSTSCEFESQKGSLIRDRIVYGIQDKDLQERLLREPNLTLLKAMEMCKTDEISKQQIKIMQNNQNICQIRKYEKKYSSKQNQESEKEFKCQRCGKSHRAKNCPAWG
ncbi:K02A2.6-like [Cordylochernes scorpioides]|uniref:K02A2.6-like n=1 Tax=Cordylochernes scorpioides TaxID=51811 RepID=A0ABY6KZD0_9ARAC|nr:K02A2.6-like [Cordylochernes scorpioides]